MLLMVKGGVIAVPWWAGLGGLGGQREREVMQDATTSESEREMTLILMSRSAGGALMALVRMGDSRTGCRSLGGS